MLQQASDGFSGSFHSDSQQQQMDNGDSNGMGIHRCCDWRLIGIQIGVPIGIV